MTRPHRIAFGSVFGVGFLLGVALAGSGVTLRVRTVLATNTGADFDARLEEQRRQLEGLFRYSSFQLVREERRYSDWGKPNSFEIPGGRFLQVVPKAYQDRRLKLKVVLIEGSAGPPLDTDFSLPNNGNIWVGGPKHSEGVLLISIGVEAER